MTERVEPPAEHRGDHDAISAIDAAVAVLRLRIADAVAEAAMPTGSAPTLSTLIQQRRAALGLSLEEVARGAGCTKSHVWEMEQGRSRNPTVAMVYALSRALAMPFPMMASAALATVLRNE